MTATEIRKALGRLSHRKNPTPSYLLVAEAARAYADYLDVWPTPEAVEAAARAMNALPGLNRARGHEAYMRDARAALEAARPSVGT